MTRSNTTWPSCLPSGQRDYWAKFEWCCDPVHQIAMPLTDMWPGHPGSVQRGVWVKCQWWCDMKLEERSGSSSTDLVQVVRQWPPLSFTAYGTSLVPLDEGLPCSRTISLPVSSAIILKPYFYSVFVQYLVHCGPDPRLGLLGAIAIQTIDNWYTWSGVSGLRITLLFFKIQRFRGCIHIT